MLNTRAPLEDLAPTDQTLESIWATSGAPEPPPHPLDADHVSTSGRSSDSPALAPSHCPPS